MAGQDPRRPAPDAARARPGQGPAPPPVRGRRAQWPRPCGRQTNGAPARHGPPPGRAAGVRGRGAGRRRRPAGAGRQAGAPADRGLPGDGAPVGHAGSAGARRPARRAHPPGGLRPGREDLDGLVEAEGIADGRPVHAARAASSCCEETYCRHIGVELAHIYRQRGARLAAAADGVDPQPGPASPAPSSCSCWPRSPRRRCSSSSCRPSSWAPSASRWRAPRASSPCSTGSSSARRAPGSPRSSSAWPTGAASTCWPTCWASRPPRSSPSSSTAPPTCAASSGGDVKYHLGYSSDRVTAGGRVHISLAFNPSHLEWVNTVVQGRMRAKQDRIGDRGRTPRPAHPDPRRRRLRRPGRGGRDAEHVGPGRLHRGRHHPPGRQQPDRLHHQPRRRLLDHLRHRRRAHAADPDHPHQRRGSRGGGPGGGSGGRLPPDASTATSSSTCGATASWATTRPTSPASPSRSCTRPSPAGRRRARSTSRAFASWPAAARRPSPPPTPRPSPPRSARRWRRRWIRPSKLHAPARPSTFAGVWSRVRGGPDSAVRDVATAVTRGGARRGRPGAVHRAARLHPPPQAGAPAQGPRRPWPPGEKPIDWGMGEALAFGTLLGEGVRVRMSGQDVRRGTFSHRHAVLVDYADRRRVHAARRTSATGQGPFEIRDSPLSEAGVLGFEYGYSLDMPEGLVIWEAQFGDFVNGAQVIIDQFLVSSEAKWNRVSGLVMLLPHGMEGQGPEHSSARLERFLNMCVNDNIQVCNVTTPAQFFHLLRRQVMRPYRKPLIVMSPKSLLRHPAVVSPLRRVHPRAVPAHHPRHHRRPQGGRPGPAVQRQGLLRPGRRPRGLRPEERRHHPGRAAVSPAPRGDPGGAVGLPRGHPGHPGCRKRPRNMGAWTLHQPGAALAAASARSSGRGSAGPSPPARPPDRSRATTWSMRSCSRRRWGCARAPSSSTKDRSRRVPPHEHALPEDPRPR